MKRPRICTVIVNNDLEAVKKVKSLVDLFEVRIDLIGDSWQELALTENDQSMTRHDGRGTPKKYRMDWILHSPEFAVSDAAVLRDNMNGLYPSDHYPYLAELVWKSDLPGRQDS